MRLSNTTRLQYTGHKRDYEAERLEALQREQDALVAEIEAEHNK